MIIIHCVYEEFKPETYQGMRAQWPDERCVTFFSSDPSKDLVDCANYLFNMGFRAGKVATSSSVDQFFADKGNAADVYTTSRS